MCTAKRTLRFICTYFTLFLTTLGVAARGQTNPAPLVNQPLVPTTAAPGGAAFTLTVNGTGFVSTSVVQWNNAGLVTQFVSASQLTATVPASNVATAGTAVVTVSSPAPGGGVSNPELFSVASPRPAISLAEIAGAFGEDEPVSLAVADFNGDGKQDLAVTNLISDSVSISLGNGDGTFQPQVPYPTGALPYSVVAADLNHDGKVDLVTTNTGQNTVSVLLGNGDGTFQPHVDYAVGTLGDNQMSLAVGDFNRDGNPDLAVCNYFDGTMSILLGNGDGTFQPQLTFNSSNSSSVAVGDFNRDGILDLAISGFGVQIWLGNGDGTFRDFSFVSASSLLAPAVVADLNGDGKLDLVTVNQGTSVYVALGNGDGTFQPAVAYPIATSNNSLAIADFNGDGKLDLAASSFVGTIATISTLLGNGDGTFQTHVDEPVSGQNGSLAVADFNGDGLLDIAALGGVLLGTTAEFSPYLLNFGDVSVGVTGPPQTVTLFNANSSALTISNVAIGAPFAQTNNCGGSLAAGASCSFNITFTPTQIGNASGSLTVTDSAQGSQQLIRLSGTGVATAVSLAPSSLVFADQKVGTLSAIQTVTLTNVGNSTLTIGSISANSEFRQNNNCGSSLPAGAFCTISVVFAPSTYGTKTGSITVTDNAAGSPQTVPLTGTGIVFELSPPQVNFGAVVIGQTASQNVTLTNSSKSPQTVGGIRIAGNHAGEFTETNNCGTSLGAGGSCTITVTFAPTETGVSQATLQVSGGGANQNVYISGTGTQ